MDLGTGGAKLIAAMGSAIGHFGSAVAGGLAGFALAAAIYTVIGVSIWLKAGAPRERSWVRGAVRFVFPRETYRDPAARVDMWNSVFSVAFWWPVTGFLFAIWGSIPVDAFLHHQFGPSPFSLGDGWGVAWLQFAVLAIAADFGFWVGHYVSHNVPLFWRVHRAHHSADVLTVLTAFRVHPLEIVMNHFYEVVASSLAIGITIYLTGTAVGAKAGLMLGAFGFFLLVKTIFDHTHFWISLGPLNRVFCAPVMHQFHHSSERRHWDHNLGRTLMLWDWIFGTLYLPKDRETFAPGLNAAERGEGNPHGRLRDYYLEPVVTFFEYLFGGNPERRQTAARLAKRAASRKQIRQVTVEGGAAIHGESRVLSPLPE